MKKNFLRILFILISFETTASICTPDELERLARELSVPNCARSVNFDQLRNKSLPPDLCTKCKDQFEQNLNFKIASPSKQETQKEFLNSAFKEYKKNIIENLLQVTRLRTLQDTGANFTESIKSCKLPAQNNFLESCSSPSAKKLIQDGKLLDDLSTAVKNELASILNRKQENTFDKTLLARDKGTCFIPETDLLYHSNQIIEQEFTPDIINFFRTLDSGSLKTMEELATSDSFLEIYPKNSQEFFDLLKAHPLFSTLKQDPKKFLDFFKGLPSPTTNLNFKSALYNKNFGDEFDKNLALNCQNSQKALVESICSKDFEDGKLNPDIPNNFMKSSLNQIRPSASEFSTTNEDLNNSNEILKICKFQIPPNAINLTEVNLKINSRLEKKYQDINLEEYQISKYKTEVGNLRDFICTNQETGCNADTLKCKILKSYKSPTALDKNLASSSNSAINNLLREMIGDTTKIDPKTREILVTEGIIPKADGSLVPQPEVPERKPDYYSRMAEAETSRPAPATTTAAATAQSAARPRSTNNREYNYNELAPTYQAPTQARTDSSVDRLLNETEELKNIQRELGRRLAGLPNQKPATRKDAQRVVRQTFEDLNRPLSAQFESDIVDEVMASAPQPVGKGRAPATVQDGGPARVSKGPSAAERAFARANAALLSAQEAKDGAQAAAGVAAAGNPNGKSNTNAEPVKTLPSIQLPENFNKNQIDTKAISDLIKTKSNFLLQIGSLNFKILFDQRNSFTVLYNSGNSTEAERMRPQLESFLRKLKI